MLKRMQCPQGRTIQHGHRSTDLPASCCSRPAAQPSTTAASRAPQRQPLQQQMQLARRQLGRRRTVCRASDPSDMPIGAATPYTPGQRKGGSKLPAFLNIDGLPPKTQSLIITGFLVLAFVVGPFLQPTWLYGGSSNKTMVPPPSTSSIATVVPASSTSKASEPVVRTTRYTPGISEVGDALKGSLMPKTLPDGRVESPGFVRMYLVSMALLAVFYACSLVIGLIFKGVAAGLRKLGILGPERPPGEDDPATWFS